MQIKTAEGERNVASKALGGTALGLAIPGTLAFLGNLGNMLGTGNYSRGGNGVGYGAAVAAETAVDSVMNSDTRTIGCLVSQLGQERAERYADNNGISLYERITALYKAEDEKTRDNLAILIAKVADMDKHIAVEEQRTTDNLAFLNQKIDDKQKQMFEYVNATFVPGVLKMPLDSVCPQPMQRYNYWVAPTTTASASATQSTQNTQAS